MSETIASLNEEKSTETSIVKENELPNAVQIVSIGNAENAYAFTFHEKAFLEILSQIPPGWKISVVSVVGAFRKGKSFLLSWFLRYLHYHTPKKSKDDEKEVNEEDWYHKFSKLDANSGFHWKGGSERNTTGIWMWSEPFFLEANSPGNASNEPIALVLMDTQGMFDHETSMELTASIFGLSTLVSSFQIYNVDKNIQEDNLQQLALFTEYGRMVMTMDKEERENEESKEKTEAMKKPFQRIEFLVRDWQHFEADEEGDIEPLEKEMSEYLTTVLGEKELEELNETRDQIIDCFEEISCYMLTHPGPAVTKKKYDGDTSKVDPIFLKLLDRFCHKVLGGNLLKPKMIHGRALTVAEFAIYVKVYAGLFEKGADFPEATTMLEATALANNTNATSEGVNLYKEKMNTVVGPQITAFVKPSELEKLHTDNFDLALETFDRRANFGNKNAREKSKRELIHKINEDFELFTKLNEGRNAFHGLEVVFVPLAIGFLSFVLRYIADSTCSSWSQTCKASSDLLAELYTILFIFLLIVASTKMKEINEIYERIKETVQILQFGSKDTEKKKTTNTKKSD